MKKNKVLVFLLFLFVVVYKLLFSSSGINYTSEKWYYSTQSSKIPSEEFMELLTSRELGLEVLLSTPSSKQEPEVLLSDELITQIRSNCRAHNMSVVWNKDHLKFSSFPRRMLIQEGLAYVVNPKTGSTSFRFFLKNIRRINDGRDHHILQVYFGKYNNYSPSQFADLLDEHFKLVFIRNPLLRILSGFRDKVLRKGLIFSKGKKWGKEEYPANATEYEIFAWFVGRLTNYNRNQGLLKGNVHFLHQYEAMHLCNLPYDFIGQVELSSRDLRLVQTATNTTNYEFPGSRSEQGFDAQSTIELANRFWGNISSELLQSVYDYYKLDFEILGYPKLHEPHFPYITKRVQ